MRASELPEPLRGAEIKQPYRKANYNGMNWITQIKRLAIYLRDGLACVYCGESIEDGARLTLDHVLAVRKGGTNHESNVVTACTRCNLAKGQRNLAEFCRAVAVYLNHDVRAVDVQKHVLAQTKLALPLLMAKEMIDRRGSAAKALAALREGGDQ